MKILVIGSEGTIGTELVKKLEVLYPPSLINYEGTQVYRCDRKRIKDKNYFMALTNHFQTLDKIFYLISPNIVLYLAGEVSRETAEHWPSVAIESNVSGTLNVLECCRKYNSSLLYTGTSEEYGSCLDSGRRVSEGDRPAGFKGMYGLTKWMAEELIEYYFRTYKIPSLILRIFMCYGPGEYPSPFRSAVSRFIDAARRNEPLYIHRNSYRSWCYIDDVVEGIIAATKFLCKERKLLEGYGSCEVFNIGRDELVSTEHLAKIIIGQLNSDSKILVTEVPKGITLIKNASFERAKHLLNWTSKVSLEEGLSRTIKWNIENVPLRERNESTIP